MQFTQDFCITEVVANLDDGCDSVLTTIRFQEYGVYTFNYSEPASPVMLSACLYSLDADDSRQRGSQLLHSFLLHGCNYDRYLVSNSGD